MEGSTFKDFPFFLHGFLMFVSAFCWDFIPWDLCNGTYGQNLDRAHFPNHDDFGVFLYFSDSVCGELSVREPRAPMGAPRGLSGGSQGASQRP